MTWDARDRRVLKRMLEQLRRPVRLTVVPRPDPGPDPAWEVVDALVELAPSHIRATRKDPDAPLAEADRWPPPVLGAPVILVPGPHPGYPPFIFQGVPAGYQFATLFEAIIDQSTGRPVLGAEARDRLRDLPAPVSLTVFVLPTCPYSPRAARLAQGAARANRRVHTRVVDVGGLGDAAQSLPVEAVPRIVVSRPDRTTQSLLDGIPLEHQLVDAIREIAALS